ncbi:23S rRNA (guanine(2445)-N(2))/(guanine(2069)-N(7))-methyltransferase [Rhodanobacter sp. FW510-R12]|uniref:bifunctional 23S rRNA (guanine(2069)-N(7))-methyltransferase RlmK/23S rRNA (guanine(2445)-N(2))-methyltransferase RlmL n=1 Tax=unclassified Rhodanobacter TaxID=2621553 RepID=UPI0007A99A7F|nr:MULTISPECIES: bifunctional 23S rRNA (guanine(2069)-N(7))-methyltransferase RlmK/23S rRNA (guanine(2445)-N(2))-methyltransferase RlmL [unclassified Rhodanobacter]KZC15675.1 23S rRNA (guanine(2445)-N(2))/(guanine(2069)-N(7))-methyltransferase [Rhodanobacter sp. FW104-R8]KZC25666.1 23S rRNA (guanine(2445)-N(2))/(guanine(2069)-N(7))-methyltransferase [Rhodanobacter sp. FW510-T8]KZC32906.1 23S rRNA (guanine(2445)-N(2))/(guanine(2069)-N(7))-methyltransferase [Rhodanobacter sp. FW510-R10]
MNRLPSGAFFATCPKGMEYLLRDELVALGAGDVREALAGAHFAGTLETAYRACLWSRLASRILLPLAEFDAADDDALYRGVQAIDWSEHLAAHATFAVDAGTAMSKLTHSQFIGLRVKDAVVDQFRQRDGSRPGIDTDEPDIRINVRVRRDRATLSLDLAGSPLHRRGWREEQGEAPLKENLAAAMLLRARWPEVYAAGGALLDPMCGSGTLLIEGALMASDVASGLRREYFGFLGWQQHDIALWRGLLDEAKQRAETGLRALRPCFFGSDADTRMVQTAKRNAQEAGVAGFFTLDRQDVAHAAPPPGVDYGLVITNPPYGERLGDRAEMPKLYRVLGDTLRSRFSGWRAAVLAGDVELGRAMQLHADKRYALYNGALETVLLTFDLKPRDEKPREPKPLSAGAQMLKNRLEKNTRHLRKRLAREGIHCWRAYDQDLPEYAAAIDVYGDTNGDDHLHIQEYRAPADIPADVARLRLREIARVAGEVLGVPRERIALKTRERGKGGSKYGQLDQRGEFIEVEEGGLKFLVNLTDYLDTGLFLDHRLVRAKLRELARGRCFLNLFAYTATASAYAAAGGALETTSVDLSATYLEWASRNLALNGFSGARHRLMQFDALEFLQRDRGHYGLIFVDPPTFSNSKRAEDFDVQRDHVALLDACRGRLTRDGVIVFSNNFRRFKLDREALEPHFEIEDWSAPSIPFDFARRADIHGCWLLRRRQAVTGINPWDTAHIKK